jgi:hypothetical protein
MFLHYLFVCSPPSPSLCEEPNAAAAIAQRRAMLTQQRRGATQKSALLADDQEISRSWKMISNLAQRFTKLSNPMNQTDWSNQMSANRALRNGTSFSQGAGQGALTSSPLNFY